MTNQTSYSFVDQALPDVTVGSKATAQKATTPVGSSTRTSIPGKPQSQSTRATRFEPTRTTDEFIWYISDLTGKELKRRHGLSSTYRLGCKCDRCHKAHVKTCKAYRLKVEETGGKVCSEDIGPVQAHIRMLKHEKGMSYAAIGRQAGLADTTVGGMMNRRRKTVYPETAAKILAITGPEDTGYLKQSHVFPDLTAKRLQSLVALGYSLSSLRRMVGVVNEDSYHRIALGKVNKIQAHVAEEVRDLYFKIGDRPFIPANRRERASRTMALKMAAKNGWGVPATWDDPGTLIFPEGWGVPLGDLFPPTVDMVLVERIVAQGNDGTLVYSPAERTEAIRIMMGKGVSHNEIRSRLRISTQTWNKALEELKCRTR